MQTNGIKGGAKPIARWSQILRGGGTVFQAGAAEKEPLFLYQTAKTYKVVSGYGEEPLRAFLWLLALILLPMLPVIPGGAVYYYPLSKARINPSEFGSITVGFMTFWQLMITIQAGLFGSALRNKFRR